MANEWQGDNPFFLIIQTKDKGNFGIDLDEPQWATTHADVMREPGAWMLNHKEAGQTVAMILVRPGEQPYYTRRTVGIAFGGEGKTAAYGLGKKRVDGHTDRIWILPNGVVCTGDDIEDIALAIIKAGGL